MAGLLLVRDVRRRMKRYYRRYHRRDCRRTRVNPGFCRLLACCRLFGPLRFPLLDLCHGVISEASTCAQKSCGGEGGRG